MPPGTRLRMLKRGFLSESYVLYDLANQDIREYLPDLARLRCQLLNGRHSSLLNNKLTFAMALQAHVTVPRTRAYIFKGRIIPMEAGTRPAASAAEMNGEMNGGPAEVLSRWCREGAGLVLKHIAGLQGQGIFVIKPGEGQDGLRVNGEAMDAGAVRQLTSELDEYIVSEFVQQHEYADRLFSGSANTIRLYTMIDPETGEPFVPVAIQRMGTRRTAPVDNWSRGGVAAMIDLETGRLSKACGYPGPGGVEWFTAHPDSGAGIEGAVVAHWQKLLTEMRDLAGRLPFLKFVGWDVLITPEGFCVIEGNDPGFNLVQMHYPMLRDERVRKFFRHHRIIAAAK